MNTYFYVASDFERNPEKKNFNVWAYAMVLDEASVVKAIDTAFYINRKYKGAIIKYGFTSLSERQLQIELNKQHNNERKKLEGVSRRINRYAIISNRRNSSRSQSL